MENITSFTLRIHEGDADWLNEEAERWGMDRSTYIRYLIKIQRHRVQTHHNTDENCQYVTEGAVKDANSA